MKHWTEYRITGILDSLSFRSPEIIENYCRSKSFRLVNFMASLENKP